MRFVGWSFGFVFVSDYAWLCAGLRLVVFRVAPNCDGLFVSAFFFTCCVCFYFFCFIFLFSLVVASLAWFRGCREFGVVSRLSRCIIHTYTHT